MFPEADSLPSPHGHPQAARTGCVTQGHLTQQRTSGHAAHGRDASPRVTQGRAGLSSSIPGMCRALQLSPGSPGNATDDPLLFLTRWRLHMPTFQTKALLALDGKRREHWAVPHSPCGAATQALTPELQPLLFPRQPGQQAHRYSLFTNQMGIPGMCPCMLHAFP